MISLQLPQVPMPDPVVQMIGTSIPLHVLQAQVDADMQVREIGRLRPLAHDEDRQDFETALADLARANKILASHDPRFIVRGAA
ncbi:hypothetical protein [Streptomyces sp. NPDC058667]|uniref:hypothetical protein n=1 Tax=Streptomyces sp. NPDC058667 TaxID=3346588 RepID=UPI00365345F6